MKNEILSFKRIALLVLVLLFVGSPLHAKTVTPDRNKAIATLPAIIFLLNSSGDVSLGSTGKLRFPEGSLPPGTKVTVKEVPLPRLPDGLIPVGSAYRVDVSHQPTLPVEITMQVPKGEDAEKLILIRLESFGRLTLLQTHIEKGMLVAQTPGLSTLLVANREALVKNVDPKITGPDLLPINMNGQYTEEAYSEYIAFPRKWEVYEFSRTAMGANLIVDDRLMKNSRALLSAKKKGMLTLTLTYTEPVTGLQAFGSKNIMIIDSLNSVDSLTLDVQGPNIVNTGESFDLLTEVLNTDKPDIVQWSWQIGDQVGSNSCEYGCSVAYKLRGLQLENSSSVPQKKKFTITSTSASGAQGTTSHDITVLNPQVRIVTVNQYPEVDEDGFTPWNDYFPHIYLSIEALISGGAPPYTYDWELQPLESAIHPDISQQGDFFDAIIYQPGSYKLLLKVTDAADTSDDYRYYIHVKGTEKEFSLSGLPQEVFTNQPVKATLKVKGGSMYVFGSYKPGYVYVIQWGDKTDLDGKLSSENPSVGAEIRLSHTYTAPGIYTIKYLAWPVSELNLQNLFNAFVSMKKETITVKDLDQNKWYYYLFKRSGTGYRKYWGGWSAKMTGYDYFHQRILPSEYETIKTKWSNFDEATDSACAAGNAICPCPPYPDIWEPGTGKIEVVTIVETSEELEPFECENAHGGPWYLICNMWNEESESYPGFWPNINGICGY